MELTEQLIEAVKKYKILYDLSDPGYKNNRSKNKIWDEIGVSLGLDGMYTFYFISLNTGCLNLYTKYVCICT